MFSPEFYNWKLLDRDLNEVTIGTMLTSFSGVQCEVLSGGPPTDLIPNGYITVDRGYDHAIVTYPPAVFSCDWVKVYLDY